MSTDVTQTRKDSETYEEDYHVEGRHKRRWFLLGFVALILGILFNFPFSEIVDNLTKSALTQMKSCPIKYQGMKFGIFPPGLKIVNPIIPGQCLNKPGVNLKLKTVSVSPLLPSFSPLGLRFLVQTGLDKTKITSMLTASPSTSIIDIQNTSIELGGIMPLLTDALKLLGKVDLTSQIDITPKGLKKAVLFAKSKNIFVPAQNIQGVELPGLSLGNLALKAKMNAQNKLTINTFIIGDANSPIRASFSGEMKINQNNINQTTLDLKGEVAFSEKFLNSFSILNLFLQQFNQKEGFYQIKITGPLSAPQTGTY